MNCLTNNLDSLNEQIANNIEIISRYFNLSLHKTPKCWLGACPIHGGDNDSALNIYYSNNKGYWRCNTHECHKEFSSFATGFVRGLLSKKQGWPENRKVSLNATINWCNTFFKNPPNIILPKKESYDSILTKNINHSKRPKNEFNNKITKEEFRSGLIFPCEYFISRGFRPETLEYFDVGTCLNTKDKMNGRGVVPIYDSKGEWIIASTGRSIYNQCSLCGSYHDPMRICPSGEYIKIYSKWKHSKGFPSTKTLYNFHNAEPHIKRHDLIILVEGTGSVWRLFEAGFPMAVSTFGINLGEMQKFLIDETGISTILVLQDVKEGHRLVKNVIDKCEHTHTILAPTPSYEDDIGACDVNYIKEYIGKIL